MKRENFGSKEKMLIHRVKQEYKKFKYRMLLRSKNEIYDRCNKICFVESIYEYFIYVEEIPNDYVKALFKCKRSILGSLYEIYLNNEQVRVETWDDIDELLKMLVREQKDWYELTNRHCG